MTSTSAIRLDRLLPAACRWHPVLCAFVLMLACKAPLAQAQAAPRIAAMAERVAACTGCHGVQGRAGPDGYYPRIAGKPESYLYNQLRNFRDGRRRYPPMNYLLANLSDDYLRQIAHHFATQHPPYPAPVAASGAANVLERGRWLATQGAPESRLPACTACHGRALSGTEPGAPGLLGLPRDYISAQLGAWRNGTRRAHAPDCMADVARALTPDDINAVSTWLALQPPSAAPAASTPSAPLPVNCGSMVAMP